MRRGVDGGQRHAQEECLCGIAWMATSPGTAINCVTTISIDQSRSAAGPDEIPSSSFLVSHPRLWAVNGGCAALQIILFHVKHRPRHHSSLPPSRRGMRKERLIIPTKATSRRLAAPAASQAGPPVWRPPNYMALYTPPNSTIPTPLSSCQVHCAHSLCAWKEGPNIGMPGGEGSQKQKVFVTTDPGTFLNANLCYRNFSYDNSAQPANLRGAAEIRH